MLADKYPRDEKTSQILSGMLDDTDLRVSMAAAKALKNTAIINKKVGIIVQGLNDENVKGRADTCMKLVEIGFDAAPALPKLKELAQADPDVTVRNHAKRAIAKIEPLPYERLVELLDDPNWLERKYAAEALGYIGPEAKKMLPKLEKMVEYDDSRQVRDAAKETIVRFEGPEM
jgi:HEAT repeat protein